MLKMRQGSGSCDRIVRLVAIERTNSAFDLESQPTIGLEIVPAHYHILSRQATGIGIEQKLVRIESVAVLRAIGTVGAIAVDHAGSRIGQIAVPDFIGTFRQIETRDLAAPATGIRVIPGVG